MSLDVGYPPPFFFFFLDSRAVIVGATIVMGINLQTHLGMC